VGLQVHPGAEGVTRAGDDHHVNGIVLLKVVPRCAKCKVQLAIDGVLRFRPIQA
jgi:hypothetical protein